MILTLAEGHPAITYGMFRTIVITSETCHTAIVVTPLRHGAGTSHDIAHGAYGGTSATLHTTGGIHTKMLVCDKMPDKISAEKLRIDSRPVAYVFYRTALPAHGGVSKFTPSFKISQSPNFHKLGLCYSIIFLYLYGKKFLICQRYNLFPI